MTRNNSQEYDKESIIIELSVWKLLFLLLVHILYGVVGIILFQVFYVVAGIGNEIIFWLLVFLIGFALIMRAREILEIISMLYHLKKAHIRLDGSGLHFSRLEQIIDWHEIKAIQFRNRKGAKWIEIKYETPLAERLKVLRVKNYFELKPEELKNLLEESRDQFLKKEIYSSDECVSRLLPG